ncbi:hypothetical protein GCM10009416_36670 [Craurococcus roseus]|uniref:Uncharacterized protein n=1 Tax=Craurococcus roseus TaxID=77585 RepID=A0ABN1FPC8_9PROT
MRPQPVARPLPTDERDRVLSDDLWRVGREKSIGYLPLYTVRDVLGADAEVLAAEAASRGLSALRLGPCECCIKSGALYVFDRRGLAALLASANDVLTGAGWPVKPEAFARAVASDWVEPDDPVLPVIRRAFGDALGG